MSIIARFPLSLDGFSAGPDGWPAILAAPDFDQGKTSHGIREFIATCDASPAPTPTPTASSN